MCNTEEVETKQNIDENDHETVLNILLQNPEDFNLKQKPSGIRENKMFTLDARETSISSAKADDNGVYMNKGSAKKCYIFNEERSRIVHSNENGGWYINVRGSKGYSKVTVLENEVFELKREYHTSKHNPKFSRMIATVKAVAEREKRPFYLIMYKWADGQVRKFHLPQHGNATKSSSGPYFRKDPSLFTEVDNMLEKGLLTDQVYTFVSRKGAGTVSETISGPKLVDNRKLLMKRDSSSTTSANKPFTSEAGEMISLLRSNDLLQSVTFTKEHYVTLNLLPQMLNDLHCFCVLGDSILRVDTTFELVEGLWLTATTYSNEALVHEDLNGKNPEFPGPSFWPFRKSRECYRRFAGELVIQKAELRGIKKIGHGHFL